MTEVKNSIFDGQPNIPLSPLEAFVDALPPGPEHVLLISPRLDLDLQRLKHRDFDPATLDARSADPLLRLNLQSLHPDVRIAPIDLQAPKLPAARYRGIFLHELFAELEPAACLAWVSAAGQALVRHGVLWVASPEARGASETSGARKAYTKADLASLLKQSGFELLQVGRGPSEQGETLLALLARRL
jgi:hypothetical protein